MNTYFYLDAAGEQQGPVEKDDLLLLLTEKRIASDAAVFREGDSAWRTVRHYPELLVLQKQEERVKRNQSEVPDSWRQHTVHHTVHHTGRVTTKARGSGIVAIGSIMCFVGAFFYFSSAVAFFAAIGMIIFLVGFVIAVVGRLMS